MTIIITNVLLLLDIFTFSKALINTFVDILVRPVSQIIIFCDIVNSLVHFIIQLPFLLFKIQNLFPQFASNLRLAFKLVFKRQIIFL